MYNLNEGFFDEPWTEENAYVLGYLFADGSIYTGKTKSRYELTISSERLSNLETIKELMESEHPIERISEGALQVNIGSKVLVNRLGELGLKEGKRSTLSYPPVPVEVERHFLRGYFDGKGSFMIESGRRIVTSISGGCESFIETLRDRFAYHGLKSANIHHYGADESSNVIRYYVKDTKKMYDLFYTDATYYSREQKARYDGGC